MPYRGKPRKKSKLRGSTTTIVVLCLGVLGSGCDERDRLTFPTPSDGVGPITMIDQPNGADTTVIAGPEFFVNGRTIDPDGVDTVYFLVTGGNQSSFQPFVPRPPSDTVRFGLPLATTGRAGDTILVQIHGVDSQGNRGGTSVREIVVE
jgi:hypothetical protein